MNASALTHQVIVIRSVFGNLYCTAYGNGSTATAGRRSDATHIMELVLIDKGHTNVRTLSEDGLQVYDACLVRLLVV